jgi:hypothetical protein
MSGDQFRARFDKFGGTCKGGGRTSFFGKKKKIMNSDQDSAFGQRSFQAFLFQLLSIEPLIDPKLSQLSP